MTAHMTGRSDKPQPGRRRRRRRPARASGPAQQDTSAGPAEPAPPATPQPTPPAERPARAKRAGRDGGNERGLRDLIGAGRSQLGVDGALRGRDVNRPTDQDLADAERDVVIVRRNWKPPRSAD
jgi:hypothetical protein